MQPIILHLIVIAVVIVCGLAFVTYNRKQTPTQQMEGLAEDMFNDILYCKEFTSNVWLTQIKAFEKYYRGKVEEHLLLNHVDNLYRAFNHRNIKTHGTKVLSKVTKRNRVLQIIR